ncbi:MAG: hypothetical protein H0W09_01695 [Solirubrobacterales bacterium]|nr:hypothetical protein [Solirubrobacterales bacterium]
MRLTSPPGPRGGRLARGLVLELRRQGVRGSAGRIWSGKLAKLRKVKLGVWARNETRGYVFRISFPDTGIPAGPGLGDNRFQGTRVRSYLRWSSVPAKRRPRR